MNLKYSCWIFLGNLRARTLMVGARSPEFRSSVSAYGGPESRALSIYLRRVIGRSYGRSIDRPITRSALDRLAFPPYPPVTGNRVHSQLRVDHRRLWNPRRESNPIIRRAGHGCARPWPYVHVHIRWTDTRGLRGAPGRRGFHLSLFPGVEVPRARLDGTTIMAALTEIRHCFPCRGGTMGGPRRARTTTTSTGRARGHGVSQNSGGDRVTREKNKRGENARVAALFSLSLPPPFRLYLSPFSPALSSPVCAGERLPILRQGQDRDFNQLAGFLGPGKWLVIRPAAGLSRLLASSLQPRTPLRTLVSSYPQRGIRIRARRPDEPHEEVIDERKSAYLRGWSSLLRRPAGN